VAKGQPTAFQRALKAIVQSKEFAGAVNLTRDGIDLAVGKRAAADLARKHSLEQNLGMAKNVVVERAKEKIEGKLQGSVGPNLVNRISQREYLKALRNAHPMDRFDVDKRAVNIIGRITAAKLNRNSNFIDALKDNKITRAGNIWHNTAKEVADKFAKRAQKLIKPRITAEETLKSGRGGSRLDLSLRDDKGRIAEFDWKTTARSALKSIKQMEKHAGHVLERTGSQPRTQGSRSWEDYTRSHAPDAAQYLRNAAKNVGTPTSHPSTRKLTP